MRGHKQLTCTLLAVLVLAGFTVEPLVAPTGGLEKRVVLVIDKSGSMDGSLGRALGAYRMIAEQPTDDMELAVYVFGVNYRRYPTSGFLKLPDAHALKKCGDAVAGLNPGKTATNVVPVMISALSEPGPCSVVLVSDGEFSSGDNDKIVAYAQVKNRSVMCLAVTEDPATMEDIGRRTGGGAWQIKNTD